MGSTAQTIAAMCVVAALALAGCGSSRDATHRSEKDIADEARRYEADFRPSDFLPEPPIESLESTEPQTQDEIRPTAPVGNAPQELVPGFRVQMFSSNNIDDADNARLEAEDVFPGEWFYVVYDPPTYKVRGGNFPTRWEADRFAQQLRERGYRDAWIVPERVYKNPSPRPSKETQEVPRE